MLVRFFLHIILGIFMINFARALSLSSLRNIWDRMSTIHKSIVCSYFMSRCILMLNAMLYRSRFYGLTYLRYSWIGLKMLGIISLSQIFVLLTFIYTSLLCRGDLTTNHIEGHLKMFFEAAGVTALAIGLMYLNGIYASIFLMVFYILNFNHMLWTFESNWVDVLFSVSMLANLALRCARMVSPQIYVVPIICIKAVHIISECTMVYVLAGQEHNVTRTLTNR